MPAGPHAASALRLLGRRWACAGGGGGGAWCAARLRGGGRARPPTSVAEVRAADPRLEREVGGGEALRGGRGVAWTRSSQLACARRGRGSCQPRLQGAASRGAADARAAAPRRPRPARSRRPIATGPCLQLGHRSWRTHLEVLLDQDLVPEQQRVPGTARPRHRRGPVACGAAAASGWRSDGPGPARVRPPGRERPRRAGGGQRPRQSCCRRPLAARRCRDPLSDAATSNERVLVAGRAAPSTCCRRDDHGG